MPSPSARSLRKLRRLARRKAALRSHRLFTCSFCSVLVRICRRCDRGQRSCSPSCSAALRKRSLRWAGQQYQRSELGRARHAARQRAYRLRKKLAAVAPSPLPCLGALDTSQRLPDALQPAAPSTSPGLAPVTAGLLFVSVADFNAATASAALPASLPPPPVTPTPPHPSSLEFSCCHRCGANPSPWLRYGPLADNHVRPLHRPRRTKPSSPP